MSLYAGGRDWVIDILQIAHCIITVGRRGSAVGHRDKLILAVPFVGDGCPAKSSPAAAVLIGGDHRHAAAAGSVVVIVIDPAARRCLELEPSEGVVLVF